MSIIEQKFDNSLMWVEDEGDGEVQLTIRLTMKDEKPSEITACIWLDTDQRKDLIETLQRMENKNA